MTFTTVFTILARPPGLLAVTRVVFGQQRTVSLAGVAYVAGYFLWGVALGPRMTDAREIGRRHAGIILALAYLAYWTAAYFGHFSHVSLRPSQPPFLDVVNWIGVAAMLAGALAWLTEWSVFAHLLEKLDLRKPQETEREFGDRAAVWYGVVALVFYLGWWFRG